MPTPAGPTPSPTALTELVRRGDDRDLSRLAARGLLPLAAGDLIPLQVALAEGGDEELAPIARAALAALDPRLVADHVAREAGEAELSFFAAATADRRILEALITRRDVPRHLLVEIAPRLPSELQEALARRQDALIEEPAIADALALNPGLTSEVARRLGEYRRHLLRRPDQPEAGGSGSSTEEAADLEAIAEAADEEMRLALAAAAAAPAGEGERDATTGLTEAQVRMLPVPVRMRLTRGAPRNLRQILVRDTNPVVARAVLVSNAFSEQEIEAIASNRTVQEEVLSEIAQRREWVSSYRVALALTKNPRTPLPLAVRLVARLSVRDLRLLSRDRNIPNAVRTTAQRLYRIKRV